MPQFHPARDIHDVYFVKRAHACQTALIRALSDACDAGAREWGATGSTGWGYNLMRNAPSGWSCAAKGRRCRLISLAGWATRPESEVPWEVFLDRAVFSIRSGRCDTCDRLFPGRGNRAGRRHQLRSLLGLLNLFAREVAQAKEVKFVPAYFPFTEPSVELHVRHPKLGWMELGGAGFFRPEVPFPWVSMFR